MRPLIGITADLAEGRFTLSEAGPAAVADAGGVPVILPCRPEHAREHLRRLDGVILSGGDDPIMERWSIATHPKATPIDPARQAYELALLEALDDAPDLPVLGICLGMQLMGLHRGADLDQHLPDTLPTAADHWGRIEHAVEGSLGGGLVQSHHRQALRDPGELAIVARAHDGVIEAVRDDTRPFYLGVQWHPERTGDEHLGAGVIRALVDAARST